MANRNVESFIIDFIMNYVSYLYAFSLVLYFVL